MTKLVALALVAALAGIAAVGTSSFGGTDATQSPAATAKPAKKAASKRGPRGLRGKAGPRGLRGLPGAQGVTGETGAHGLPATDAARSLVVRWRGSHEGRTLSIVELPGIGRMELECSPERQQLRVIAFSADRRVVIAATTFEGTDSAAGRYEGVVTLPPNGMVEATISAEPLSGDGGAGPAPATVLLSSERVLNDGANNFCNVAAQVLQEG